MPVGRDGPPPSAEETAAWLARWPDDVAGLRVEWESMKARWLESDARARALGETACHERVAEEWSYVETLRHLVFVIDAWVTRCVLGDAAPYHREALPPTFLPDLSALGIDMAATVTLDEAVALRADVQAVVDRVLANLDDAGLSRVCDPNSARGYPPTTNHTVLHCLKTVFIEEDAHNEFANRDLAALEARR